LDHRCILHTAELDLERHFNVAVLGRNPKRKGAEGDVEVLNVSAIIPLLCTPMQCVRDHCHMLWEGSTPAIFTHEGTQGRGASTGRTQRSHCEGGTSSIIKGGRRKDGKEGERKSTISSSLSSIHCPYTTSTLCLRCVYLFTLLVTRHPDTVPIQCMDERFFQSSYCICTIKQSMK